MITTEAEGFEILVSVLERRDVGSVFMCNMLKNVFVFAPALSEISRLTRELMAKRIMSALPVASVWVGGQAGEDDDDEYGPRIIAAQWFALEAAEEGV